MALRGHKSAVKKARRSVARAKQRGIRAGNSNSPPKHARCTLMRGSHELPHQSQILQRDLDAEEILRSPGEVAMGFVRKEKDPRSPYTVLLHPPGTPTLAWKGFYTTGEARKFADSYGLKLRGGLTPGSSFELLVPRKPRMKKLRCAGPAKEW